MEILQAFRARAHLLKLLGDELIGDDRLAVFELVKNAYDADATKVDVLLSLDGDESKIVIKDNGSGMTEKVLLEKWLEIGTDSKRGVNRIRTTKFHRMPLGEKGVGRLAVHKLGKKLYVHTRAEGQPEYRIHISWPELINSAKYLEETTVKVEKLPSPKYFVDDKTGTRITIKDLYNNNWNRRQIRSLKRMLSSLISPFVEVSGFDVDLQVPGREEDLEDVLDIHDILDRAIWTFDFSIDKTGALKWKYKFNPPSSFKGLSNKLIKGEDRLELPDFVKREGFPRLSRDADNLFIIPSDLEGIGKISGTFDVYSRRREILNAQGAYQQVINYLDEQTGVRVYRDGVRVFNYGEPGDDWLGLNTYRINDPGERIGTKSIIAAIDLDLADSFGLIEKTNREGFDESNTFKRFKGIILSAIELFHLKHIAEREELTRYIKAGSEAKKPDPVIQFTETIHSIRKGLTKHGLEKELGGKIDKIENEYLRMREVTMSSGLAGINLAVIFHEVEREVKALNKGIVNRESSDRLIARSEHLSKLLEGFAPLLKRNEQKKFMASVLTKRSYDLVEHRFLHHKVIFSAPLITGENPDFEIYGPFGLLQASLNNLIDNAIHWTRWRAEKEGHKAAVGVFSLLDWFKEGPAIVVADNGPGFSLQPDEAVQPFVTTRPGGMGLGLYYANMVMETIGGRILIMTPEELELPAVYSGAAVVLLFKGGKR